jgi:hypothetical protein
MIIQFPPEIQDCFQSVCVFVNDVLVSHDSGVIGESNYQSAMQINVSACDRVLILLIDPDKQCEDYLCQTFFTGSWQCFDPLTLPCGTSIPSNDDELTSFEYIDCNGKTIRGVLDGLQGYFGCGYLHTLHMLEATGSNSGDTFLLSEDLPTDGCTSQNLTIQNLSDCYTIAGCSGPIILGVNTFDFPNVVLPGDTFEGYKGHVNGSIEVNITGDCEDPHYLCLYVLGEFIQMLDVTAAGLYTFDPAYIPSGSTVDIILSSTPCD